MAQSASTATGAETNNRPAADSGSAAEEDPRGYSGDRVYQTSRNIVTALVMLGITVVVGAVFLLLSDVVFAQSELNQLQDTLSSVVTLVTYIVLGVAVPNAAYGFMQLMMAGTNVEQDERGRRRIRNTGIAIAGVAVVEIAVDALAAILGIGGDASDSSSSVIMPSGLFDSFSHTVAGWVRPQLVGDIFAVLTVGVV